MTAVDASSGEFSAPALAALVCNLWGQAGEGARVLDDCIVLVPRLKAVECIVDEINQVNGAIERLRELASKGEFITVVLPLENLSAAHQALYGSGYYVQGWIDRGDHLPHFMHRELA
ncbi:hypothetical protein [Nocardia colli]|uniref:hypothetical protein n=1 Tax=Nocardia colli TaxID=2545717 RepID=UPI0035DA501C